MAFYDSAIRHLAKLIRKIYRIELRGKKNIPQGDAPYLLCSNHIGTLDPVVIVAATEHKVYYLGKAELSRIPLLSGLIRAFGAIPVKRGAGDVGAIKRLIEELSQNKTVGIFPQGHRYRGVDPATTEIKSGTGMILWRSKADVIPVAIATKNRRLRFFKKTIISVGKPIPFADLHMENGGTEEYDRVTKQVFTEVCALESAAREAFSK